MTNQPIYQKPTWRRWRRRPTLNRRLGMLAGGTIVLAVIGAILGQGAVRSAPRSNTDEAVVDSGGDRASIFSALRGLTGRSERADGDVQTDGAPPLSAERSGPSEGLVPVVSTPDELDVQPTVSAPVGEVPTTPAPVVGEDTSGTAAGGTTNENAVGTGVSSDDETGAQPDTAGSGVANVAPPPPVRAPPPAPAPAPPAPPPALPAAPAPPPSEEVAPPSTPVPTAALAPTVVVRTPPPTALPATPLVQTPAPPAAPPTAPAPTPQPTAAAPPTSAPTTQPPPSQPTAVPGPSAQPKP
jgi:hypothetical protein